MRYSYSVSERYAKALFLESLKLEVKDRILSEIEFLSSLINESEEFRYFIENASISTQSKNSFFKQFLNSNGFSDLMINFFNLIVRGRREVFLIGIFDRYRDFCLAHANKVRVVLITSYSLDSKTLDEVTKVISCLPFMKGFAPLIKNKVDASTLGGFIVDCESLGIRYDSSLSGSLGVLRKVLI